MRHDGKNRPAKVIQMTTELEKRKARRKEVPAMSRRICSNCATQETRNWRFSLEGELLCTRCHRYAESKPGQKRPPWLEKRRQSNVGSFSCGRGDTPECNMRVDVAELSAPHFDKPNLVINFARDLRSCSVPEL
jgi:hypothetical protein